MNAELKTKIDAAFSKIPWEQRFNEHMRNTALIAIKDAGFAVVPREPTEAMIKAGGKAFDGYWSEEHQAGRIYQSMLTASQREGDGK